MSNFEAAYWPNEQRWGIVDYGIVFSMSKLVRIDHEIKKFKMGPSL